MAAACSLKTGITWEEHAHTVFAINQVAAVLQAVCALLSLKVYLWCRVGRSVAVISGVLFVIHPGLYVASHPDWIILSLLAHMVFGVVCVLFARRALQR